MRSSFVTLITCAVSVVLLVGCEPASEARTSTGAESTHLRTPSPVEEMDALDQAEIAFVGGYGRPQIQERLDTALRLYGHPITQENYSRAASALVALRKENGTSEMAILDHMIRSHTEGVNINFPEAAALSSVFLASGDQ